MTLPTPLTTSDLSFAHCHRSSPTSRRSHHRHTLLATPPRMAGTMSCTSAWRPMRQAMSGAAAAASTSRSAHLLAAGSRPMGHCSRSVRAAAGGVHVSQRSLSFSARCLAPPPPSPEPAVSRPLDTPPSPIPVPGKHKSVNDTQQQSKSRHASEKEEACQSLSPSSPAAPRSQGSMEKGKAKESQEAREAAGAARQQSSSASPKAIAPETVTKPSAGRKTSGKAFKAQKAALTLVSGSSFAE